MAPEVERRAPIPAEEERGRSMEGRLRRTMEAKGLTAAAVGRILGAHEVAMERRRLVLHDPHDPRYLHPGRTMLILLDDAGWTEPVTLAAAPLLESEDVELRVPTREIARRVGDDVAGWREAVPAPEPGWGRDSLVEALVMAPREAQLLALAERLDHLRHLPTRSYGCGGETPGGGRHAEAARDARDVYLPLSTRVHPVLHRRFRWWCTRVGRRWE